MRSGWHWKPTGELTFYRGIFCLGVNTAEVTNTVRFLAFAWYINLRRDRFEMKKEK